MRYEINNLMKKRLNGRDVVDLAKQQPLESRLKDILDRGIINQDDLILLKNFKSNLESTNYTDPTGKEMFVNKFHVDNYSSNGSKLREYFLQQGIAFALVLYNKLINNYPDKHFKIIVSTDEGPDSYPDICTVGFHTVRPNEHWLTQYLENYKMNGLLVITV